MSSTSTSSRPRTGEAGHVSDVGTEPTPESIKRGMRGSYDHAASRYAEFIAPSFRTIALRVLSLARPNSDDLHIDLATGTGLIPALADERRMMTCIPPWRAAVDLSREMLNVAHQASPPTRLVQGDLERLPERA